LEITLQNLITPSARALHDRMDDIRLRIDLSNETPTTMRGILQDEFGITVVFDGQQPREKFDDDDAYDRTLDGFDITSLLFQDANVLVFVYGGDGTWVSMRKPTQRAQTLAVTVVDLHGTPIEGANVSMSCYDSGEDTDSAGFTVLRGEPDTCWFELTVSAAGYRTTWTSAAAGTSVRVVMARAPHEPDDNDDVSDHDDPQDDE
jgi:hypothetical protein